MSRLQACLFAVAGFLIVESRKPAGCLTVATLYLVFYVWVNLSIVGLVASFRDTTAAWRMFELLVAILFGSHLIYVFEVRAGTRRAAAHQ